MKRRFLIPALLFAILLAAVPAFGAAVGSNGVVSISSYTPTSPPDQQVAATPGPAAPAATAGPVIVIPQAQPTVRATPAPVVEEIDLDAEEPSPAPERTAGESAEAATKADLLGYVKEHWVILAVAVGGVTALVVTLAVVSRLMNRKRRRRNPVAYGDYIAAWLGKRGFADVVTVGRAAGDGVLLTCRASRGTKVAVLCVLSDGIVSYRTVQQADEEKDRCGCSKAAVVTNSTFSRQAVEGARALNIELMAEIE